MWMLRRTICALALSLFLTAVLSNAGCDSSAKPGSESNKLSKDSATELIPLEFGNRWVYLKTTKDDKGNVIDNSEAESRVVGMYRFGDEVWYCLNEFGFGIWVRNSTGGHYEATVSFDEDTSLLANEKTELFFKYPAAVGDSWKLTPSGQEEPDPVDIQTIVVAKVDHPTHVPAGDFSCIVYEIVEYGEACTRFYVAPGAGIVKFEYPTGLNDDGKPEVFELSRFERAENSR